MSLRRGVIPPSLAVALPVPVASAAAFVKDDTRGGGTAKAVCAPGMCANGAFGGGNDPACRGDVTGELRDEPGPSAPGARGSGEDVERGGCWMNGRATCDGPWDRGLALDGALRGLFKSLKPSIDGGLAIRGSCV